MKYECAGQMGLFDFINKQDICKVDSNFHCNHANAKTVAISCGEDCKADCCLGCKNDMCGARCNPSCSNRSLNNVPPILLKTGETIYKTVKGDVEELYVYDKKSWLCGEGKERGYRLKHHGGGYDCCWNRSIGVDVFKDRADAMEKTEQYLQMHDCIRSADINPIETVAYRYIRTSDEREMSTFYSRIGNGLVYVKCFYSYHHICKEKDGIKEFENQNEFANNALERIELKPEFKNMYPCMDKKDIWKYCEARCSK